MTQENEVPDFIEEETQLPPSFPPSNRPERAVVEDTELDINHLDKEIQAPKKNLKSRLLYGVIEFSAIIAVAILISALIKTFLWQPFEIPSESMSQTLQPGDRILVNKTADTVAELKRGDVVVFVDPGNWLAGVPTVERGTVGQFLHDIGEAIGIVPANSGQHLVKRIIGLPGDNVVCCSVNRKLEINGVEITEEYLPAWADPSLEEFTVTVPEGHLWVMGDNRSNSKDSRFHQQMYNFGFVPISNVEGRAFLRIYPFARFGYLKNYGYVFKDVPNPK